MPFNGSGTFTRTQNWAADAAAGIKIITTHHDSEDDNLAAGLSNTITRDGQSPPTANLPMGGFKHTNAANPVNPQDYSTKAYADSIRAFSTAITLTGVSTGVAPNFVSTALAGFTEADMSIVARKADATMVPPTLNRLAWNSTVGGAMASDLMYLDDSGRLVMLGTSGIWSQADAAFPVGTITERLITATETWAVSTAAKGIKYAEIEGLGCGGNGGSSVSTGAATVSVGSAGGAGGYGRGLFTKAQLGTSVVFTINNTPGGTTSAAMNGVGAVVASVTGGASGAVSSGAAAAAIAIGAAGGSGANWTVNGEGQKGFQSMAGNYFGTANLQLRGAGGSSGFGSGGVGNVTGGSSAGAAANGWGAGGAGAGSGFSGASQSGGSGSNAFIRLREYY